MEQETLPVALYQRNKALVGSRSFGGNMRLGDLVRDTQDHSMIGIVLGRQGETCRWYVKWLTGYWQGEVTSRWENNLEEINERTA